jgi:hypothetical protein
MNKYFRILIIVLGALVANSSFGQYSGTYTVGGTNPDFPRLDTAFKWLALKGVSGSVRLNVRSGTYTQRFTINKINGTSNTNIIKIAPDPTNKAPVVYQNNMPYTNAYLMEIRQGFVEIDSIEFRGLRPNSMAGRMIAFADDIENITFNGCKFYGIDSSGINPGIYDYYGIFYKNDYIKVNNLKILYCTFTGGCDAINFSGTSSAYASGIEIKYNKFYNKSGSDYSNQRNAISLGYINNPIIEGNYIYYGNRGAGILINNCTSVLIKDNAIFTFNFGLSIGYCSGSAKNPNLIINNFVSSKFPTTTWLGDAIATRLWIGYSTYFYVLNNTIFSSNYRTLLDQNILNVSFQFNSGAKRDCMFKNNNIVNSIGGNALYLDSNSVGAFSEMDYNNYYTDGPYLAFINKKQIIDITGLQKALNMENHSISANVKFKSDLDLHAISADLDSAGTPVSWLSKDIDAETRHTIKPDIGADEFDYYKNDIGVLKFNTSDIPECGKDSTNLGVVIKNIGTSDQTNFKVSLEIKNDSNFFWSGSITYSKTLRSEMMDTIRFTKFKSINGGRYKFKAITNLSSDADRSSDTITMMKILTKLAIKPTEGNDTICSNVSANLGSKYSASNSYKWYDTKNGGKLISDKSTLNVKNLVKDTTFYVANTTQALIPGNLKVEPEFHNNKCKFISSPISYGGGVYFDIMPKVNLSVDSFATYLSSYGMGGAVSIYFKRGSYSGFETLPKKWTRLDTLNVKIINSYSLVNIPLKNAIKLKKDTLYSFYIFFASPLLNPGTSVLKYSNSDMTLNLGGGGCYYFKNGSLNYPGQIYYTKFMDCESERVPYKVKVKIGPVVNLGRDTSYCSALEDSLTLNAGAGYAQYIWNTAQTTQTIKINKAGKYSVKVTNNTCPTFDTIIVNKFTKSKINLGKDTAYCSKSGINLNLNPGSGFKSYQWSTGAITQILNVKTSGNYFVKVVDKNNCEGYDTLKVTKNINPVVNLGRDTTYCINIIDSFKLKAGVGYKSYQWSTFETKPQISIVKTGKYSVVISDSNNCKAGDTINIAISPKPNVNLGKDTIYCSNNGISLTLDAGGGNTNYSWSTLETTPKITVKSAGNYSVEVTGSNKCKNSDTIRITSQTPIVNLGPDRILNPDNPINEILNAGPGFKTYEWSTLSKVQTLKVTKEGVYFVKVTDSKGCEGTDSIEVRCWKKGNSSLLANPKIKVYPNPAKNLLNISSQNLVIENLRVFEMSGRLVFESFEKNIDFILNTSYWANGFYFIDLAVDGKKYKMKFSVQH